MVQHTESTKRERANDDASPEEERVASAPRTDDGNKDAEPKPLALTAMCFDVSGSMRLDGKNSALKKELLDEVRTSKDTKFLIIAFNDTTQSLSADGLPMDKESAINAITTLLPEPGGGTAIYKAVSEMGRYVKKAMKHFSNELLILKIFTDGDDNESTEEDSTSARKVVNDIRGDGGVVTLLQAGSSTLCANALDLDENAVLYFSDQGSTLANAALAAREASVSYRHAVLSRAPTMQALPAFSYTPLQRAMSVDTGALPLRSDSRDTIGVPSASIPHLTRQ